MHHLCSICLLFSYYQTKKKLNIARFHYLKHAFFSVKVIRMNIIFNFTNDTCRLMGNKDCMIATWVKLIFIGKCNHIYNVNCHSVYCHGDHAVIMTLTIKVDLDTVQVDIHVNFPVRTSNGSVVRVHTHTHTPTHTHWFYYLLQLEVMNAFLQWLYCVLLTVHWHDSRHKERIYRSDE